MKPVASSPSARAHAVVIGGSVAGLLAARVLSERFARVTVLERDVPPETPEPRKSAPQGRHVHVLLEAGILVLERLLPGLLEELRAGGAEAIDMGRDLAWFQFGAWKTRTHSGVRMLRCTRPFLEWGVRRRVAALPGVTLRHGVSVEALCFDGEQRRVSGVRLRTQTVEEVLEADLVVDASGRGTRTPKWLEAAGFGTTPEEHVGIDLAYTTRLYEPPQGAGPDWAMLIQYPRSPDSWRAGFISPVEGGRWLVSLNGYFGDHAPTDPEGFLAFARSLPRPDLARALEGARPLTAPVVHKVPTSRWLHYERLPSWPERLVVLGDAVCAFNPIFGQGMTVAALGVESLAACLAEGRGVLDGLAPRFQRQLPRVIRLPWFLTSTVDLHYPQAVGTRMPGLRALQWYVGRLFELTSRDTEAYRELCHLLHLRKGLGAILHPRVSLKVLAHGLRSLFVPLERCANVDTLPPAPGAPARLDPGARAA